VVWGIYTACCWADLRFIFSNDEDDDDDDNNNNVSTTHVERKNKAIPVIIGATGTT
jgi:hypothetical protein